MRVLLDTHILIYRESDRRLTKRLQDLLASLNRLGAQVVVHSLSVKELEQDKNIPNRQTILSRVETYLQLDAPMNPNSNSEFIKLVGSPADRREHVDNHLLYSVYKREVDYLVTDDSGIHEKASKIGISHLVFDLVEAVTRFQNLIKSGEPAKAETVIMFYRDGDLWVVGIRGKETSLRHLIGMSYIHFLLQNEGKGLSALVVETSGKQLPGDDSTYEDPDPNREEESAGDPPANFEGVSVKKLQIAKWSLERKKKELDPYKKDYADSGKDIDKQIAVIDKKLGEVLDHQDPALKHAQSSVQRGIKRALERIQNDGKGSYLKEYLNESTIETGYICSYNRAYSQKVRWILFESELRK